MGNKEEILLRSCLSDDRLVIDATLTMSKTGPVNADIAFEGQHLTQLNLSTHDEVCEERSRTHIPINYCHL